MHRTRTTAVFTLLAAAATTALGVTPTLDGSIPEALISADAVVHRSIARIIFSNLPAEHQAAIELAGGIGASEPTAPVGVGVLSLDGPFEPLAMGDLIAADAFAGLRPVHQRVLTTLVERFNNGEPIPATCYAPGTDPDLALAFNTILERLGSNNKFQQTSRWSSTATDGGGLGQGDPTTLTYSYVPDGTFVPDLIGTGSGNSELFAWLDGVYASTAQWQALFDQIFDRWEEISGLSYVYEPNDDGSSLNVSGNGQLGVRGDLRIAAIHIDGNSGILAYNNFPQDGDMVFDAFDSFYNSTGSNSLRFRNVAAHEHGHGMGLLHVCPANGTKLMEPFISTAYDGPQIDDILNSQRHYGDPLEDNDTRADATALGSFSIGSTFNHDNVSIDDNNDADFYRIDATEPIGLAVTIAPNAAAYQQGTQTSSCNSGTFTDYNIIHDLRFEVQDASGAVIGSINDTADGEAETGTILIDAPGTYYLVVRGDNTNSIQRYSLDVEGVEPPFVALLIALPGGAPGSVLPSVSTPFDVTISEVDDTLSGTPQLMLSIDGGGYAGFNLTANGGDSYTASIPGQMCDSSISYYISALSAANGEVTLPEDGAADPFTAVVGLSEVVFTDTFTSSLGWTVGDAGDDATTGIWQRGTPQATAAQPGSGSDDNSCYATHLAAGSGLGSWDVDNGKTTLLSPVFDLSAAASASVSYSRWYSNDTGGAPNADVFVVDVSDDGGSTWSNLETVGPSGAGTGGGWIDVSYAITALTGQVQFRFIASDEGTGSLVEAAVDAFSVDSFNCVDIVCPWDLTGDGIVDSGDLSVFINAYLAGDLLVDFTGDGIVDAGDLSAFITGFLAGC